MNTYRRKNRKANLTRKELFIDLAVLLVLLAFVLPSYLRSQIPANELEALGHIRALTSAQNVFHSEHGRYASTLRELGAVQANFLDANWAACIKSGYSYALNATTDSYTITASPILYETTGTKYFFTDCSGIVRFELAGGACRYSAPVDEVELAQALASL